MGGLQITRFTQIPVISRGPTGPLFLASAIPLLDLDRSRHVPAEVQCHLQVGIIGGVEARGLNVLLGMVMSGQMPQRPGAFAAQFAPETLQRFKDLCRQQDKAYSKVLERLAVLYIETNGAVLADRSAPGAPVATTQGVQKRQVQVETLQNKLLEDLLKRVELLEKKDVKMLYELDRVYKELAFLKSGLQSPG